MGHCAYIPYYLVLYTQIPYYYSVLFTVSNANFLQAAPMFSSAGFWIAPWQPSYITVDKTRIGAPQPLLNQLVAVNHKLKLQKATINSKAVYMAEYSAASAPHCPNYAPHGQPVKLYYNLNAKQWVLEYIDCTHPGLPNGTLHQLLSSENADLSVPWSKSDVMASNWTDGTRYVPLTMRVRHWKATVYKCESTNLCVGYIGDGTGRYSPYRCAANQDASTNTSNTSSAKRTFDLMADTWDSGHGIAVQEYGHSHHVINCCGEGSQNESVVCGVCVSDTSAMLNNFAKVGKKCVVCNTYNKPKLGLYLGFHVFVGFSFVFFSSGSVRQSPLSRLGSPLP